VQMNDPIWHDKQQHPCPEWEDMLASEILLSRDERNALAFHIEQCPGCRQTQLRYRAIDKLARRFFVAGEPLPAEAPLLPSEKPIITTPTPAIGALPARLPINLPNLGRSTRVAWGLSAQVISALPSLVISSITGLLIFTFSQVSITFWHMPPAQALPLAAIGTAILLWPILGHLQFKSTVQTEFGLAGNFLPPIEQEAALRVSNHAELMQPGKESATSNRSAFTRESQNATPGRQIQTDPLTQPRRRRIPIPHMAVLLLLAIGIALFAVARLNPPPDNGPIIVNNTSAPSGLSIDGNHVFDLDRPDAALKLQAARAIKAGNTSSAQQLLQRATLVDSNDAEALIYQENLNVLASHRPYETIVVATTMDLGHIGGGRDALQGAYVAQKEVNDNARLANGTLLRLVIASVGFNDASAREVAQQIAQAAQKDHTIVGVMGFPTSASTLDALPILAQAHIPIVSSVATSDDLTNKSPYFFRVVSSDMQQGIVAARYAKQVLHAQHVALFEDPNDSYSHSLASAFKQNFEDSDHTITIINYTREQPQTLPRSPQQIEALHADLLYFSGYVNDASILLQSLPPCTEGANNCLQVMGGDALYVQGDYSLAAYKSYSRLIFTAFAFPDTWKIQGLQEPVFFNEYATDFDPRHLYQSGTYGRNHPDAEAILAYDATQVLVHAILQIQTQTSANITPLTVQQALSQITGNQSVQGVSGNIAFHNGEVTGKPVLVLQGGTNGQTSVDSIAYP
jgi:ABC-type branched-subunit amino acid transport system substrate-binding protein